MIDLKSDFLSSGTPFDARRCDGGTDISDIIFTSGTTGRPKGVMMNHQQNLRLYAEWCELADLREGDRYLMSTRTSTPSATRPGCIASFIRGATMLPVPVFDIDRVVELIERETDHDAARAADAVPLAARRSPTRASWRRCARR